MPELPDALLRQPQMDAARATVFEMLPVKRALGDGRRKAFTRIDIDPGAGVDARVVETRLALKRRAHLITNAALEGTIDGVPTTVTSTVVVADLALPSAERVVRTPGPVGVKPDYSENVDPATVRLISSTGEEAIPATAIAAMVTPGDWPR